MFLVPEEPTQAPPARTDREGLPTPQPMRRISKLSRTELRIIFWILRGLLAYFLVMALLERDWLLVLGNAVFLLLAFRRLEPRE